MGGTPKSSILIDFNRIFPLETIHKLGCFPFMETLMSKKKLWDATGNTEDTTRLRQRIALFSSPLIARLGRKLYGRVPENGGTPKWIVYTGKSD